VRRVKIILIIITLLELWALYIFREHPLVRPEWYGSLLLGIQLLMGVGGVYACRWMLRKSPIGKLEGPKRDWTKLWLWCGPLGGLLLVKFCILGKLFATYLNSIFVGWLVTAHIAGGAVIWLIALPWAVTDLFNDETTGFRERLLMQLGIASHVIGLSVYLGFFPGRDLKPVSLLAAVYFFGSILYYLIAISVKWSLIFRFWKPRPLDHEEQEANKELASPEDYIQPESQESTSSDAHE
jgi:hypothetical protein